jgi:hypothetical protein
MDFPYPKGTVLDFSPHKLPSAYLAAIGQVVAASAQTENAVQTCIGACLGVDVEYAGAVTTHMTAPLRDSVLRAVAEIRIDSLDALDRLDDILDEITKAFGKRNAVVHHSWCQGPDGRVFTVKETARGRYEMNLVEMTVDHIEADARFINDAGLALITFMMDLGLAPTFPCPRPRGHKSKAARKKRREAILSKK